MEDQIINRIARRLATRVETVQADTERKYGIERFKALEAQVIEGTTNPIDAEVWLNQIKLQGHAMF